VVSAWVLSGLKAQSSKLKNNTKFSDKYLSGQELPRSFPLFNAGIEKSQG
jgi:hypothetical protein